MSVLQLSAIALLLHTKKTYARIKWNRYWKFQRRNNT